MKMKTVGSSNNAGVALKALTHPLARQPRPVAVTVSSAGPIQLNSRNYYHDTDSNGHKKQICGSGVYIDNREVPITSLPPPFTVTPAPRKRRRVEPLLLVNKAMLPAPALFNAFGNREMQRCVSPASVVPMTCHAINHNCEAQGSTLYNPGTRSTLNTVEYTLSASPAPAPDAPPAIASSEEAGFREAALALTSLWCPQTTTTENIQPLTPSVSTIQSYNHVSSTTVQDPPCLRWGKPAKPLD